MFCLASMASFAHTDIYDKEDMEKVWCLYITIDNIQVGDATNSGSAGAYACFEGFTLIASGSWDTTRMGRNTALSTYSVDLDLKDSLTQAGFTVDGSIKLNYSKNTTTQLDDGSTIVILAGVYPVDVNGKCTINVLSGHKNSTIQQAPNPIKG